MENSDAVPIGKFSHPRVQRTFSPTFKSKRPLGASISLRHQQPETAEAPIQSPENIFGKTIHYIQGDVILTAAFVLTGTLFLYSVLLIAATFTKLPPVLPLFYSLSWGDGQLIATPFFMLLPLLVVVAFIVNTIFSMAVYRSQPVLSHLLFLATPLFTLLLTITATKIIFLVVR